MPPQNRWTHNPNFDDGTDINWGIVDEGALKCCDYCDKEVEGGGKRCPICDEALYCSLNCQKDDLFHHKLICASIEGPFSIKGQRVKNGVRAILFDLEFDTAEFVLIDKSDFPNSVAEALGVELQEVIPPVTINEKITHRRLNHGIQVYLSGPVWREDYQWVDEFNRCTTVLSRPGLSSFHYCSFLFCAFRTSPSGKDITFEDMTMKDYTAVIDYFQTNTYPHSAIVRFPRYPLRHKSRPGCGIQAWPAVKVNCEGDIRRLSCLTNDCWSPVEDVLVTSCNNTNSRQPTFLAALAGLPWMTEFVYCDSLTPKERKSYGGRIFANILYEGNDGERVLVAQAHPGTFYVMNYDGSPIHPNHVLAFNDFAESQLRGISQAKPPGFRLEAQPVANLIYIPLQELQKWFTRERFQAYWRRWLGQPERKVKYNHNDCGLFWYPLAPFYYSSIEWDPYLFTEESIRKDNAQESDKASYNKSDSYDNRTTVNSNQSSSDGVRGIGSGNLDLSEDELTRQRLRAVFKTMTGETLW